MQEVTETKLVKWPFILGDAILFGSAFLIYQRAGSPLGFGNAALATLCILAGAGLAVVPFWLEFKARTRLAEAVGLATTVAQIKQMETVAGQIAGATGRWQNAQEAADKSVAAARAISDRMAQELKGFTDFVERTSNAEKANLRLEVEKLRRGEAEWLQVVIRMLDHTYALTQAAARSGIAPLIEQTGQFQNACRDAARRVGLLPFVAAPAEPFDSQRHKLLDGEAAGADALIGETLATGFTFQGRLLRPALVTLQKTPELEAAEPVKTDAEVAVGS